jgi:alkanesulfonate monooxygenase
MNMKAINLHWYLPTHGDGRTLTQAGAAPQALYHGANTGSARAVQVAGGGDVAAPAPGGARAATIAYMQQVARAAESSGFDAVLTPTGTWCEEAWIVCSSLIPVTERLRFLVAFRPGSITPTLAAQQAATFQRLSGGRLMLNVVTGAENAEQRRFGDDLDKDARYARTDEFLTIFRGAWGEEPFDFRGEHLWAEGAYAPGAETPPAIYFGGASDAALAVAAKHAEVYLNWGEPPPQIAAHFQRVGDLAAEHGRALRYGVRIHVVARPTADEAWRAADALLADADPAAIRAVHESLQNSGATGQRRMAELHGGSLDELEIYPNVWAGVGLLRAGAGTALVGSYEQVADRMAEYVEAGVDEFILSGYPHVEEAYWFADGVLPLLRERRFLDPVPGLSAVAGDIAAARSHQ